MKNTTKEEQKQIISDANQTISNENREYEQNHKKISLSELKNGIQSITFTKFNEVFNYLKNLLTRDKQKSNDDIERK